MARKTNKKPWRVVFFILLCVFVLGISIVWHCPAARVWQFVQKISPQPLPQVGQISGTLAAGEMRNIQYQNKQIDKINWQMQFLPLLILQARGNLHVTINPKAQLDSDFSRFLLGKKIVFHNTHYQSDLAFAAPYLNLPILPVSADIVANFEEIVLNPPQMIPETMTGTVNMREVKYTLIQPASTLGAYEGKITRVGDKIQMKLSDAPNKAGANPLSARGEFFILPNRSYQINITLAGNTPQMANFIQGFGQKDSSGGVNLNYQGSF